MHTTPTRCQLNAGGTQRWWGHSNKLLAFVGVGAAKTLLLCPLLPAHSQESPVETVTTLIISYLLGCSKKAQEPGSATG